MDIVKSIASSAAAAVEAASYPKLNNARSQIRLLRLLPASEFTAPLSIELFVPDMEDVKTFKYEALSYCWGTTISNTRLTVNGAFELDMTTNLESAMRHLRHADVPRTLWIDAICINQQSVNERNQQVQLMASVYTCARSVIIWLGPAADDSDYFFEILGTCTNGLTLMQTLKTPRFRQANHALCNRAWFGRVWIVQELALARGEPEIICGSKKMGWEQFVDHLSNVQVQLGAFRFRIGPSKQRADEINTKERTELITSIDHLLYLEDVRWQTRTNLKRFHDTNEGYHHEHLDSLPTNMHRMRFAEATNPRDKVYGLLGISAYPHPEVDYECDIRLLFHDIMFLTMIEKFQHGFPAFPLLPNDSRPSNWPSWVPDFAASPARCKAMIGLCPLDPDLEKLLENAPWPKDTFPVYRLPKYTPEMARVLVTGGRELGTVIKVVETLGWPNLNVHDSIRSLQKDVNLLHGALETIKPGVHLTSSQILDAVGAYSKFYTHAPNFGEVAREWDLLWTNKGKIEREIHSWEEDFIHRIFGVTRTRCIVVTDMGRLAVCPVDAGVRVGDMIAGLFGLDFPMVVRQVEPIPKGLGLREGKAFTLVSVTYVAEHKMSYFVDENNKWREGTKLFAFV